MVKSRWRGCFGDVSSGSLLREIGRFVFLLGANGGVGPDVKKGGSGAFVFAVGEIPEDARDGVPVIAQRQGCGAHSAGAALAVSVVQCEGTHTHGDIRMAANESRIRKKAAVGADDDGEILIVDGVADEIRSGISFCQFRLGA